MTEYSGHIEGEQTEDREQAAQKRTKQPLHDWDAPDWSILDDRRGELPDFPLDCLGAPVREWVELAADGAGVTAAHVAVPALGIASSLIGVARRVQASKSWRVPMTCWSMVVGASGTGKTPGIDVLKHALDQVRRDNRNKVAELRRQHETKAETAKAARAQWKKQVEEAVATGQAGPQMPEAATDPGKFIEPRPYISDITIERIGELLLARPQGTLLLRDELSALFLNMSRYSGGQDKPFWLEAWNGGSSVVERMSRSVYIKHLLVGVVGGIQPSLLEPSFEGDHDGMYTRFLFAWPPEADYQTLTDNAEEVDPDIINIVTRLERLAEFEDGNLVPRSIVLSAAARAEFEELRKWAHHKKKALDGREREWMAKATAHALRLSGTLCLLDWALHGEDEPTEIGSEHMRAAIRLVRDYFWPHARAALRQIGLSDRHVNARRVLRWIKVNREPGRHISIEDIRVDALARKLDAEGAAALLATLERSGWVRWKEAGIVEPTAGRPALRWEVNPRLFRLPEIPELPETYTNDCTTQPAGGVSGIPGISGKRKPIANGGDAAGDYHHDADTPEAPAIRSKSHAAPLRPQPQVVGGSEPTATAPSDTFIPEAFRRCDHCGQPATPADPMSPHDWPGRPDGVRLHQQCEARWFENHKPAPISAPEPVLVDSKEEAGSPPQLKQPDTEKASPEPGLSRRRLQELANWYSDEAYWHYSPNAIAAGELDAELRAILRKEIPPEHVEIELARVKNSQRLH